MKFKALRSLLTVFDDISAEDHRGADRFSYVNEEKHWAIDRTIDCGSYRQDLWYCALKRSGLDVCYDIAPCARIARYTRFYTPKPYLALCHLDFWNIDDFDSQVDHLLLEHSMIKEETRLTKRLEEERRARTPWRAEASGIGSTGVPNLGQ